MAKELDILKIKPTQLCKDLKGRFVLLYSLPKTGKTSMSVMWPKPLLCAFEVGYNALAGVRPVDIDKWSTFKKVCRQLKSEDAKKEYQTIVIDTVSIAANLCEKYICQREGVDKLGDIPYGAGWRMFRDEFETTFRELTQLGYALVFICHSKQYKTEMTDDEGNELYAQQPDLTNSVRTVINGLVDVIGYIGVEFDRDGNSYRYLYTRSTPTIFAGSRYRLLPAKIKFGYKELVDAISKAMEDEAKETGTDFITENEYDNQHESEQEKTFDEVMNEAEALWNSYLNKATSEEDAKAKALTLNSIVYKIFGKQMKLSSATPAQQDLVELVIDEFKTL